MSTTHIKARFQRNGFTLIETLITVAILSVLVSSYSISKIRSDIADLNQRLSDAMVEEIVLIGNQAQTIYAQTGSWPDSANQCAGALSEAAMKVIGVDQQAPFPAVNYVTRCGAKVFVIVIDMPDKLSEWAHYIAAQTSSISNAALLTGITYRLVSNWPTPADITLFKGLLDGYYKTDGSTPMTGNMDLAGNDIIGIKRAYGDDFEISRGTSGKHSLSKTVEDIRIVHAGDTIAKPNCRQPKIYITSAAIGSPSGRPITSMQWTASSSRRSWKVENTFSDDKRFSENDKNSLIGIAIIKCL